MLADGVYLNLGEARYFAEPRLGSTDMSRLYLQEEGWWWKSHLNPDRVEEGEDNSAKIFGKALHALILEGDDAYAARFSIVPDKDVERKKHGPLFCDTVKEIEAALEKRSFNPKGNQGKTWLIDYAKTRAPDLVIWDAMIAAWKKDNVGKEGITAAEDRQLRLMANAVRTHQDIGELFKFGPSHVPLSEVTVLWHDEHNIPRRARFDSLLPQTTVDVKTLANVSGRPLKYSAGEHLAKLGYHVQMADHHEARKWAYRLITAGAVFDGVEEDKRTDATVAAFQREEAWIKRFPKEAPNWDYAWIFYQKPDAKKGMAPIVFPWQEDYHLPGTSLGELHLRGYRCRHTAIQTFRRCMAQFGASEPWIRVEPVHTSADGAVSRVFVPPYIGGDEAVPGEDDL